MSMYTLYHRHSVFQLSRPSAAIVYDAQRHAPSSSSAGHACTSRQTTDSNSDQDPKRVLNVYLWLWHLPGSISIPSRKSVNKYSLSLHAQMLYFQSVSVSAYYIDPPGIAQPPASARLPQHASTHNKSRLPLPSSAKRLMQDTPIQPAPYGISIQAQVSISQSRDIQEGAWGQYSDGREREMERR